ncbi:MAG: single-stranded-DNA-specific exonuclease RecJ [Pirellulaceae bacterium]
MRKRWRIEPHDADRIGRLERSAGVPPIVAQLLLCRGVHEPEHVKTFLESKLTGLRDPDELPGCAAAADRVHAAIRDKRKIVIYGDYDADGMTGTAILIICLRLLGADVSYYVPNRLEEGYGLSDEALRTLAGRGASLVISVDCGIASLVEADTAKALGLELIVTDHHEFAERLPDAAAIVHPRLPGHSYPFAGLCGAGVAFKLAWAICQRASESKKVSEPMRNFLLSAVGLAALGTVADMVPLLDENRIIVRHGLTSLLLSPPLGIKKLLEVTKLHEKASLNSENIAFTLAPRLNAAGRFGQAQLAVELMTTDSEPRAQQLAEYIHELNGSRDSLERSILIAANKQIKEECDAENDPAFVLAGRGWHVGVIGLVAGKLAEKFGRPVIVIALDALGVKPGVGSARSGGSTNLHHALAACSEHLLGFGGHAAAAGLKIDESRIEAFRGAFCDQLSAQSTSCQGSMEICIDGEAPLSQLTAQIVHQIEQMAPFGAGNPRPVLCATGVKLAEPPKKIGSGERHLSFRLVQHRVNMRGVGFGFGEHADELSRIDTPLDIAYRPVINEFNGRHTVEVQLVDWRVSEVGASK